MKQKYSDDNPLTALLETERLISEQLTSEQSRAEEWLASQKKEISEFLERGKMALAKEQETFLREEKAIAETRAETLLQKTAAKADRMAAIEPASLQKLIIRHLEPILPRSHNDCEDVEN